MKARIGLAMLLILVSTVACAPRGNPGGKEPKTPTQESTSPSDLAGIAGADQVSSGGGEVLPFLLSIGGQKIGASFKMNVPEGHGVAIQITTQAASSGRMQVVHPAGDKLVIGTWQSNSAQFYYKFPYGENHLIVSLGGKDYDVMVVAGAQTPVALSTTGCEGGYLDIGPPSVWNYEETSSNKYTVYWAYRIQNWVRTDTGEVSFSLVTEGSSGIERTVDSTATLTLICRNGTVFIETAVEAEKGIESTTRYDADTIYMPPTLAEGVWWQRQGIMEVKQDTGDIESYDVVEKFTWVGKERLKVQAGEFDCDKVEYAISRKGKGQEFSYEGVTWYVPGLGRVKSEAEIEGSPKIELVSFEGVKAR